MNKEIAKGNDKVILRKIIQQWGNFTYDEIDKFIISCEEHERHLQIQQKTQKERAHSYDY